MVCSIPELNNICWGFSKIRSSTTFFPKAVGASQEQPLDDNKNKFYKELGMFSLKKRIQDSVLRAELVTPTALEVEVEKHMNQEDVIRECDLWDDLGRSTEILVKLADSARLVDTLKDVKYKAEEAKLITELAGLDAINYALFKQAYSASLDVNKFLDKYEMSKLLKGPYDLEGACITIESRSGDAFSEKWAGQLARMYLKWAERQGHKGRIVEKSSSSDGDRRCCIIELEFKCAYGYLSGEKGVHSVVRFPENKMAHAKVSLASVDIIPLFIESSPELFIDEEDLVVSYPNKEKMPRNTSSAVHILHVPTGLHVQSTGERSGFANKVKALNRLKSKLLVFMKEQGVSSVKSINTGTIVDIWSQQETRRYSLWPNKMIQDLKSGIHLPDVSAVLNGNLDPLISAQINSKHVKDHSF